MTAIFRRTALAGDLARRLLRPGVLDEGLRSGLFLSGLRRTGKTTFLVNDLVPALQKAGAIVVYVDLWSDSHADPAVLVRGAIRKALADLQSPGSALLARLRAVRGLDVAAGTLKFGFKLEALGTERGPTLATALAEVVDQARTDVVLIVDEVQQAMATDEGHRLMLALKAARDAINPRPGTPGHFLFIGTGSHRAMVAELTARRNQAFAGATSVPYPVLGADYVAHVLARLAKEGAERLPSKDVAMRAFEVLGHRPEELLKALRQLLLHVKPGADPDEHLPVIAATLRAGAADVELAKLEQLGSLANEVFERIAARESGARGLFSAGTLADLGRAIGREVRADEVQSALNALMDANLVARRGHGLYDVSDPFVRLTWDERRTLPPPGAGARRARRPG